MNMFSEWEAKIRVQDTQRNLKNYEDWRLYALENDIETTQNTPRQLWRHVAESLVESILGKKWNNEKVHGTATKTVVDPGPQSQQPKKSASKIRKVS